MFDAHAFLARIDRMDATELVWDLAEDARITVGNSEPLVGRDAVETGISDFYSSFAGLRHRIMNEWTIGQDTIVEAAVTYTRHNGAQVTIPAVSIWHIRDDDMITDYRVFIDLAPVYAS